jgi:hypothetical protein
VYQDDRVALFAPPGLSAADASQLAALVEKAFDFVLQQNAWPDPEAVQGRFTVEVLPNDEFQRRYPGAGAAYWSDRIFIPDSAFVSWGTSSANSVAHEIAHLQDDRQGDLLKAPRYFMEGKAFRLGDVFSETLVENNGRIRANAQMIASFESATLRPKMALTRSVMENEAGGAFFLEYLRVHLDGGTPDVPQRAARVFDRIGQGQTYEAAFHAEFGRSPLEALERFYAFLDQTQDDPHARIAGTIYEQPRRP